MTYITCDLMTWQLRSCKRCQPGSHWIPRRVILHLTLWLLPRLMPIVICLRFISVVADSIHVGVYLSFDIRRPTSPAWYRHLVDGWQLDTYYEHGLYITLLRLHCKRLLINVFRGHYDNNHHRETQCLDIYMHAVRCISLNGPSRQWLCIKVRP